MNNRILIIEDNQSLLYPMEETLIKEGYELNASTHCEDILEMVMNYQPDLVILDFLLNGINGGELCHQIKNNPVTNSLPVLIISGYPRVLDSLGDYGSDGFLAKPFSLNDFLSTVSAFLPLHSAVAAFQ